MVRPGTGHARRLGFDSFHSREQSPYTFPVRSKHYVAALGIGAVLIHAAALAWVQHRQGRVDAYAFHSLDCGEYYSIARNILLHGAFSQAQDAPFSPDTWRTPGYPLFLAAGMMVVGESPNGLVLLQHLMAIGGVLLFFRLASRYLSTGRAALAAAVVLFEPYHLFYSFWLLSTTFFTLVLMASWWIWELVRERATAGRLVALGLLTGWLVLVWPGAVLIPLLVVLGLALRLRFPTDGTSIPLDVPRRLKWPAVALVTIACLVPPLAWMTRNKLVAGHFALSHQSGIVLAYFKATEVKLWRQGRTKDRYIETSLDPARRNDRHPVWEGIDSELASIMNALCPMPPGGSADADPCRLGELVWPDLVQGNRTSHDSFEISRILSWIGGRILLESPWSTIACVAVRVVENLVFPLNLAIKPAEGAAVHRAKAGLLGAAYTVLLLGSVMGVVRARRQWWTWYFPAACVIALALTTAPQIDPRFRAPLIPFLAFAALLPSRRAES